MKFLTMIATVAVVATASASYATPAEQQSTGCLWLTAELTALQADVASDRPLVPGSKLILLGPHELTLLTPVGLAGPQLPTPYTVEQVHQLANLHSQNGCKQ